MSSKTLIGVAALAVAAFMIGPALAQEPTLSQVYQAAESGNIAQAQRMMDEVLRAHPNSAKAHFVEAELLAKQGRLAAAEAELSTAERLDPGLPFAKPQAVQELKRRVASSSGLGMAPARTSGIPWTTLLLGAGLVALIIVVVRAMRRQTSTSLPAGSGYGAPASAQPYASGPVGPGGGGGIGSGILGGLATGAALGAGMVAGEALAHRLGGGHSGRLWSATWRNRRPTIWAAPTSASPITRRGTTTSVASAVMEAGTGLGGSESTRHKGEAQGTPPF